MYKIYSIYIYIYIYIYTIYLYNYYYEIRGMKTLHTLPFLIVRGRGGGGRNSWKWWRNLGSSIDF